MRKFLQHIGFFLVLQLPILLFVLSQYELKRDSFYAEINHKHKMLEESRAPRILLLGGSNVGFGFDSKRLSEEFNREVLNLGLAALIGVEPILNDVEPYLKDGDVVVYSPVYENLTAPFKGSRDVLRILEQRPEFAGSLDAAAWVSLGDDTLPFVGSVLRSVLSGGPRDEVRYVHADFNEWGDISSYRGWKPENAQAHRNRISQRKILSGGYDKSFTREQLKKINQRLEDWQAAGVKAYFSFTPIPEPQFLRHQQTLLRLEGQVRAELTIPILDSIELQVSDPGDFLDTEYHLRGQGVTRRTTRLIEALRAQGIKPRQLESK